MNPKPLVDALGVPIKPKPKRRAVPSLKRIVLSGGPPEWDGTVTDVCDVEGGTLERWDHTADLAAVWQPTEESAEVQVDRETRAGKVRETKTAQRYRYVGYREDINEGSTGTEGRALRAENVPQDATDGVQEEPST